MLQWTPASQSFILRQTSTGKPFPSIRKRYDELRRDTFPPAGGTPDKERVLSLAKWALEHGLIRECAESMDRYVDMDRTSPVAAAYAKVRDAIKRPVSSKVADRWKQWLPVGGNGGPRRPG